MGGKGNGTRDSPCALHVGWPLQLTKHWYSALQTPPAKLGKNRGRGREMSRTRGWERPSVARELVAAAGVWPGAERERSPGVAVAGWRTGTSEDSSPRPHDANERRERRGARR